MIAPTASDEILSTKGIGKRFSAFLRDSHIYFVLEDVMCVSPSTAGLPSLGTNDRDGLDLLGNDFNTVYSRW